MYQSFSSHEVVGATSVIFTDKIGGGDETKSEDKL